jgi:polyketide synthase PksN
VVTNRDDAVRALERAASKELDASCFAGKVERGFVSRPALEMFAADLLEKLPALRAQPEPYRQALCGLADLHCQGYELAWQRLWADSQPRRVRLPSYPFARDRYWIEPGRSRAVAAADARVLHPLAQRNTSDFEEQRFSCTLLGDEFFLASHVVKGQRILPGVAYLEMARAAASLALGADAAREAGIELRNVVWLRRIAVAAATDVHIGLRLGDDGAVDFEIYTGAAADDAIVHAQGRAVPVDASGTRPADVLDLAALRRRCDRSIDVATCYAAFRAAGVEYGAAHRALQNMQLGRDADGQLLIVAQVALPECVSATRDHYVLHPSVLDGALQVAVGVSFDSVGSGTGQPALPFALERLEILAPVPAQVWVVVRPSADRSSADVGAIRKLDIALCDAAGRACVRLHGFTV